MILTQWQCIPMLNGMLEATIPTVPPPCKMSAQQLLSFRVFYPNVLSPTTQFKSCSDWFVCTIYKFKDNSNEDWTYDSLTQSGIKMQRGPIIPEIFRLNFEVGLVALHFKVLFSFIVYRIWNDLLSSLLSFLLSEGTLSPFICVYI